MAHIPPPGYSETLDVARDRVRARRLQIEEMNEQREAERVNEREARRQALLRQPPRPGVIVGSPFHSFGHHGRRPY